MPQLDQILAAARATLPGLRARSWELEAAALRQPTPVDFARSLRGDQVAVIAEVKRRSPSVGAINAALDPAALALAYERGGAAAISVLTEGPHFGGAIGDLEMVVAAVGRPVLRKDFILDELQLLEARASGAAAALLIVRALDDSALRRLSRFAAALGLATLVEAHTAGEVDRALAAEAAIIGVNARNLDTFVIDAASAWALIGRIPADRLAVAESGMATLDDVRAAANAGADAVLIGTALASAEQPTLAVANLVGWCTLAVETKICGLTRPADAALAVSLGAWRLGVVFAGGPRTVSADLAREIVHAAGAVPVVGVYQSQDVKTILQISEVTGMRGAQLHGAYSSEAAGELHAHGLEVWRVASIAPNQFVAGQVTGCLSNADVLVIEPRHHDGLGGKGVALDLGRAREACREAAPLRVALAGGLTPESVREAIRFVGPEIVDVSSGVECAPGIKDPGRMARFLEQVCDAYPRA